MCEIEVIEHRGTRTEFTRPAWRERVKRRNGRAIARRKPADLSGHPIDYAEYGKVGPERPERDRVPATAAGLAAVDSHLGSCLIPG